MWAMLLLQVYTHQICEQQGHAAKMLKQLLFKKQYLVKEHLLEAEQGILHLP